MLAGINNQKDFYEELRTKGFYLFKDFLRSTDLSNLQKKFLIKNTKEDQSSKIFFDKKSIIFDYLGLKFETLKKRKMINRLLIDYKLNIMAKDILQSSINLPSSDFYLSPISDQPVIQWHTDQAYSGKKEVSKFLNPDKAALKFFFYLTDVDSENGCLGYIPGSHIISYHLKKMILEGEINYSPYWKLSDYRTLIMTPHVKSKLTKKVDNEIIDKFINDSNFIHLEKETFKFDIKAKAGSLLVFDESGVHRGNAVTKFERKCIRIFFRKL